VVEPRERTALASREQVGPEQGDGNSAHREEKCCASDPLQLRAFVRKITNTSSSMTLLRRCGMRVSCAKFLWTQTAYAKERD
jgi:hypothetical protein